MEEKNEGKKERITLEQIRGKMEEERELRAQGDENILLALEEAAMKLSEIDTDVLLEELRGIIE